MGFDFCGGGGGLKRASVEDEEAQKRGKEALMQCRQQLGQAPIEPPKYSDRLDKRYLLR